MAAGTADTPRATVAMITHAPAGDTFWDLVRRGAETAAAKDNIELRYSNDPDAPNQATLVQNAIDTGVDGIALTLAKPEAVAPGVKAALAAGIPVVALNSGFDQYKAMGVTEYFGQDEGLAGQTAGERLTTEGAKKALCVIQEQGQVALEARCAGLKKGFSGKTDTLYVNGTDMPSVKSTITAKLRADSSIDQVVTLGAPIALTAVQSLSDAGSKARIATFDLNEDLVKAVQEGTVEFAVDQQPYLQGYLAVDSLWLYKNNGNFSGGGTAPVLTGPAFITKDNADAVAEFASKGTR